MIKTALLTIAFTVLGANALAAAAPAPKAAASVQAYEKLATIEEDRVMAERLKG